MYLYDMPFRDRHFLCKMLDSDDDLWKKLAGEIGLNVLEVKVLERENLRINGSPSDKLLNQWGHLNATVDMLAYKLKNIKAIRALQAIKHLVSKDIIGSCDEDSSSCDAPTNQYSFRKQDSAISDDELPGPSFYYEKDQMEQFEKKNENNDTDCCNIFDISDVRMKRISFCTFVKITMATNNFSEQLLLKKGHFGATYKGELNHSTVAIKVLKKMEKKSIPKTFCDEIELLTKHPSQYIVVLMAISQDGPNLCLVYQYLENGSLRDRLSDKNGGQSLLWPQRHAILRDASEGLLHLHGMMPNPLIHKNIKSSNILLGVNFTAKLGDYGFLYEAEENAMTTVVTHVSSRDQYKQFTEEQAYLPDDFFHHGRKHSLQTDVYAFGMVILETCTGLDAIGFIKEQGNSLAEYVREKFFALEKEPGQLISTLKDRRIPEWDDKSWMTMALLGVLGTTKRRNERVSIQQIWAASVKSYKDVFEKLSTDVKNEVVIEENNLEESFNIKDDPDKKVPIACMGNTDIYSSEDQPNSCSDNQNESSELVSTNPSSSNNDGLGSTFLMIGSNCSEDKYFLKSEGNSQKFGPSKESGNNEGDNELKILFSSKESNEDLDAGQLACITASSDLESLIKKLLQKDKERKEKLDDFKKEFPDAF